MNNQRILLGIGRPGEPTEVLVNIAIEENNRDDIMEVLRDCVELIYDGEYDMEEADE